jgi:hypothetical protein
MNIEKEVNLINNIVLNAIMHGSDAGGSYNSNEDGLKRSLNMWIESKGLTDYVVQVVDVIYDNGKWLEEWWNIPQILEDCI